MQSFIAMQTISMGVKVPRLLKTLGGARVVSKGRSFVIAGRDADDSRNQMRVS